jgi:nuclear pore complex protein Nup160
LGGQEILPSLRVPNSLESTATTTRLIVKLKHHHPDSGIRIDGVKMTSSDVQCRYKETRLNLEPASSSSIVQVRISSSSSHGRTSLERTNGAGNLVDGDEKAWRAKAIASTSSIYYRKNHSSPRSFLWRVLDNDTILSIRAADVCKQHKEPDTTQIVNLRFPNGIRTSCIAFSDPAEHDALSVFVIDQSNLLYSITLRPDAFRKRAGLEDGLSEACKSYSPPGFGFKHPHRLVAVSSDQLIVTMHDGGILRFDKNRSHDGERYGILYTTMQSY